MAMAAPSDFARVRHELEALNHQLRRQLLDPEGYRGEVLEELFNGVVHMSSGRTGYISSSPTRRLRLASGSSSVRFMRRVETPALISAGDTLVDGTQVPNS